MKLRSAPPLIRFLLKWTGIGMAGGLLVLALVLYFDIGGLGALVLRSSSPWLALYVLAMSFAGTGGPVAVTAAVLLGSDFSSGRSYNSRLARWKAGHSAEIEEDRPL